MQTLAARSALALCLVQPLSVASPPQQVNLDNLATEITNLFGNEKAGMFNPQGVISPNDGARGPALALISLPGKDSDEAQPNPSQAIAALTSVASSTDAGTQDAISDFLDTTENGDKAKPAVKTAISTLESSKAPLTTSKPALPVKAQQEATQAIAALTSVSTDSGTSDAISDFLDSTEASVKAKSIVKTTTKTPAVKTTTSSNAPVLPSTTTAPAKTTTKAPAVKATTKAPAMKTTTSKLAPPVKAQPVLPRASADSDTAEPESESDAISDFLDSTEAAGKAKSIAKTTTKAPAVKATTKPPAVKTTTKAAEVKLMTEASAVKTSTKAPAVKPTTTAAEVKLTTKAPVGKTTTKASEVKTTKSSAVETTTQAVKIRIAPASTMTTASTTVMPFSITTPKSTTALAPKAHKEAALVQKVSSTSKPAEIKVFTTSKPTHKAEATHKVSLARFKPAVTELAESKKVSAALVAIAKTEPVLAKKQMTTNAAKRKAIPQLHIAKAPTTTVKPFLGAKASAEAQAGSIHMVSKTLAHADSKPSLSQKMRLLHAGPAAGNKSTVQTAALKAVGKAVTHFEEPVTKVVGYVKKHTPVTTTTSTTTTTTTTAHRRTTTTHAPRTTTEATLAETVTTTQPKQAARSASQKKTIPEDKRLHMEAQAFQDPGLTNEETYQPSTTDLTTTTTYQTSTTAAATSSTVLSNVVVGMAAEEIQDHSSVGIHAPPPNGILSVFYSLIFLVTGNGWQVPTTTTTTMQTTTTTSAHKPVLRKLTRAQDYMLTQQAVQESSDHDMQLGSLWSDMADQDAQDEESLNAAERMAKVRADTPDKPHTLNSEERKQRSKDQVHISDIWNALEQQDYEIEHSIDQMGPEANLNEYGKLDAIQDQSMTALTNQLSKTADPSNPHLPHNKKDNRDVEAHTLHDDFEAWQLADEAEELRIRSDPSLRME